MIKKQKIEMKDVQWTKNRKYSSYEVFPHTKSSMLLYSIICFPVFIADNKFYSLPYLKNLNKDIKKFGEK